MITHRRTAVLSSLIAGLALISTQLLPGLAQAATSTGGNGLRVSPVSTNLTINPGETEVVTITVQNVTTAPATLQAVVNDFTATGEDGAPALLLNPGQYAPVHSLKRFVAPIPNVSLAPREAKDVKVEIAIPKGTSGGGYYGAVRFAPVSVNQQNNVTLSSSVASLVLVRVPGNYKEQLGLISLDVRSGQNGSPSILFTSNNALYVYARFQNTGDVQEQPFGKITVKQSSAVVETHEINNSTPRGNVLPDSIRRFTVKLDKIGWFGKYTVYGDFGYGTNGQLLSGQTTFYIVPWPIILGVLLLVGVVAFFIFGLPKLKRQYDRNVVRRSRR